jgi:hypothetical protein
MDDKEKIEKNVESLSVDELKDILINRHLHNGWEITFARKELEKRGIELSIEEQDKIVSNKKRTIEEAISKTNPQINNWYTYDNYDLKEINVELEPKDYYSRIRKEVLLNILVTVVYSSLLGYLKIKEDHTINSKLYLLLLGIGFLFLIFISLIRSIFLNKFKLIKLQANTNGITLKYYIWNNIVDYYSSWNEIRIKRTYSRSSKGPYQTLILKNNDGILLKIYSDREKELKRDNLEKLINNLMEMKIAYLSSETR